MRATAAAIVLGCVIGFVYAPIVDHRFVEFDDPLYVTENPHVARGLTGEGVAWAFTTSHAYLWHPLTWLSYLASAELHGTENAGPWILTNVALHTAAAGLLLAMLAIQTGRLVPAILVAGVFALHPLQVEAVAWVSGRKEVLSGLFALLTLGAYGGYARHPSLSRYAVVFAAYAACLMAKGTLLGLPIVLLALDVWPLRRLRPASEPNATTVGVPLRRLVHEKLPLLGLALADVVIQLRFVATSANVWGSDPPLLERIPIAIMALGATLGRIFWPAQLTLSYPVPMQMGLEPWSALSVGSVALALAALIGLALGSARRAPVFAVGLLWFLVLLGPLTGIFPAGLRSMHDRYTYVPLIGIAGALAYGFPFGVTARRVAVGIATAALLACAVLSHQQVRIWSDSESLFRHALTVTEANAVIRYSRGIARAKAGRSFEAIADLEGALAIHPDHADAHAAIGHLLAQQNDLANALPHLERAVALRPGWALALTNLGRALETGGDRDGALARFEQAVAAAPDSADARYWLGLALARRTRLAEARNHLLVALELEPGHRWAHAALDRVERATATR